MVPKIKNFKRADYGYGKNAFFYVIASVAVIAVVIFLIYTDLRVSRKKWDLQSQLKGLEKEIGDLEQKNAQLKAQISEEQTESYLETEGRNELGYKKPGEEVVVVLPPKSTENSATSTGLLQNIQTKISDFFKNLFGR
jgi:cell division protein FtsB